MSERVLEDIVVPAREGRGVRVDSGQILELIDAEGHQVADLAAWVRDDPAEYFSPTHTVSCNVSINLATGSHLFSNRREPVLSIVRDDVERHDIIVPCCDKERYLRDFGLPDHPHCLANLEQAMALLGESFDLRGEMAWNVFMHNRVDPDGSIVTERPLQEAGATIALRAERDLVVLVSACPQDLTPTNDFDPTSLRLRVLAG
jgi:uncharacterized protein YcgI (DUF1989 family)